jgi:hypothetical protein
MKLWLLQRVRETFVYDEATGFVVRAKTANIARLLASKQSGDEGSFTWLNPVLTSCRSINPEGTPCVILRDFSAG